MKKLTAQEAIKKSRELRTAEGKGCELEYDVHGNRHSSDCPCYTLARTLMEPKRPLKIKLHFNRINMMRKLSGVWSAHTSKACNSSETVIIRHGGKVIGKTVFNPEAKQPRAFIEFAGEVVHENGRTFIDVQ
jgi:hypothetical protein